MNIANSTLILVALATLCAPAVAADAPGSWEGLVEVRAKRMDAAYVRPGADFRPYTKVMIDPAEVAFQKDWMTNVNRSGRSLSNEVTDQDAGRIAAAARSNFGDVFTEAFRTGGYDVVTAAGPDVLRLAPAIVDLYINAPDTGAAVATRSYTMESGEATLVVEARDSATGALLGRVLDRRETRRTPGPQITSSVSNLGDFRVLFQRWAGTCVKGLGELKAQSPVPDDLQPKQKL